MKNLILLSLITTACSGFLYSAEYKEQDISSYDHDEDQAVTLQYCQLHEAMSTNNPDKLSGLLKLEDDIAGLFTLNAEKQSININRNNGFAYTINFSIEEQYYIIAKVFIDSKNERAQIKKPGCIIQ